MGPCLVRVRVQLVLLLLMGMRQVLLTRSRRFHLRLLLVR